MLVRGPICAAATRGTHRVAPSIARRLVRPAARKSHRKSRYLCGWSQPTTSQGVVCEHFQVVWSIEFGHPSLKRPLAALAWPCDWLGEALPTLWAVMPAAIIAAMDSNHRTVTELLEAHRDGDALDRVFTTVYEELRRRAPRQRRGDAQYDRPRARGLHEAGAELIRRGVDSLQNRLHRLSWLAGCASLPDSLKARLEPLFSAVFAAALSSLSSSSFAHCSQACQNTSICSRNSRPTSICSLANLLCSALTNRELVLPWLARVRL